GHRVHAREGDRAVGNNHPTRPRRRGSANRLPGAAGLDRRGLETRAPHAVRRHRRDRNSRSRRLHHLERGRIMTKRTWIATAALLATVIVALVVVVGMVNKSEEDSTQAAPPTRSDNPDGEQSP